MADGVGNFRSPVLNEPMLTSSSSIMRTPLGNVRSTSVQGPPPLPPAVHTQLNNYAGGIGGAGYSPMYGGGTFGGYGGAGYGGYGGMSNYGGMSSYGGFGGYGGGYGGFGGFNSFNRFGGGSFLNPNDPENQFIQLAEESSRPAFQSIESVVGAIGNIAAMLDSTFFAITSTFRAILGVTANFGRLRGVFTQFWQTFALVRGLTWLYKKLLYLMRISKTDPSSFAFKEAFAAAQSAAPGGGPPLPGTGAGGGGSALPVLAFLGFIFTAPYLIMKLFGDVTKAAKEESRNPKTWVRPIPTCALYDFQARNPTELSMRAGQTILIGPKEIQNTHKLMNTGWALASADGVHSGLIPISYVQGPNQMKSQVPDIAQLNPATGFNLHTPEQAVVAPRTEGPQINPKRAEAPHGLSKQGTNLLPVIPESSEYSDPPASTET